MRIGDASYGGMIVFNLVGLAILAISFGIAFVAGHLFGVSSEGAVMIIAGPIAAVCDVGYRLRHGGSPSWFHPRRGGHLLFLPIWLFGVLWTVLGVAYVFRGA